MTVERFNMYARVILTSVLIVSLVGCGNDHAESDPAFPRLMGGQAMMTAPVPDAPQQPGGSPSLPVQEPQQSQMTTNMGGVPAVALTPSDYCETTVDMFCQFYMRCDRMAVESFRDCREAFLETCNERYEPIYASLVEAGHLALSKDGIDTCRTHLETVNCDRQIFDLDGPCDGVWVGTGDAGSACSVGIESFVCAPGLSCAVNTSLCGECRPDTQTGQACAEPGDCDGPFFCNRGTCQPRRLPGDPCEDRAQCVVGAWCADGLCQSFIRAKLGEPCDRERRCPYKSVCTGGVCVETGSLGEPCTPAVGCSSGYCDETCQPFKGIGQACESNAECQHNRCNNGQCGPAVSSCLTQ